MFFLIASQAFHQLPKIDRIIFYNCDSHHDCIHPLFFILP